MKYTFDEMMDRFLRPLSELEGGRVTDSLYFLRQDGSFVFSEGYCHPAGGMYGKIIYYPQKGGDIDIFGREYGCITKKMVGGECIYVGHAEQIKMHGEIDRLLERILEDIEEIPEQIKSQKEGGEEDQGGQPDCRQRDHDLFPGLHISNGSGLPGLSTVIQHGAFNPIYS